MNATRIRQAVKEVLIKQEQIILAGGVHPNSDFSRHYNHKLRLLLKMVDLPDTDGAVIALFDFPFSPFISIDPCCVDMCENLVRKVLRLHIEGKRNGVDPMYGCGLKLWTLEARIDYVLENIMSMTGRNLE